MLDDSSSGTGIHDALWDCTLFAVFDVSASCDTGNHGVVIPGLGTTKRREKQHRTFLYSFCKRSV